MSLSLRERELRHSKWLADRERISATISVDNSREHLINMAMNDFLNNTYESFENFVVRDSEASGWMLMHESLVSSANMNIRTIETAIDILHQQIIHGGTEIKKMGSTKRPIEKMKRLKSILESINRTNRIIRDLNSNSQNVNEFIQTYSLPQLIELEDNIMQKRYPQDMFSFVNGLLPRLKLEIQAKIISFVNGLLQAKTIDAADENRKSGGARLKPMDDKQNKCSGGKKRSANKRSKSRRDNKSRKPLK